MGDEGARVNTVPTAGPQSHLELCQRTNQTDPRLGHDNRDRREMCRAEIRVPDPCPAGRLADQDQAQADNDENDEQDVREKHRVGCKQI